MTKLKKRIFAAGAVVIAFAAGAAALFQPSQSVLTAYADEQTNDWVVIPHIDGWRYGSFSADYNLFYAQPRYGAKDGEGDPYSFTFTGGSLAGEFKVYAYTNAEGGLTYYTNSYATKEYTVAEISQALSMWEPGNYTMKVTVPAFPAKHGGLEASVPFAVRKAQNSWVETPRIVSWFEGEFDGETYPLPQARAEYGDVEFMVFGSKTEGGEPVPDISQVWFAYDGRDTVNSLHLAEEGTYFLQAEVKESGLYEGLKMTVPFRIFSSDAALAALDAARESAKEEYTAFAARYGVDIGQNADRSIIAAIHGVESATTPKTVYSALDSVKVCIYQVYAKAEMARLASEMGVTDYESNGTVAAQIIAINDAQSLGAIDTALRIALAAIYKSGVELIANAKKVELKNYADGYGITLDNSITAALDKAETEEEVELAFRAGKKSVILSAFQAARNNTAIDVSAYRTYALEAIRLYAEYVGVEYKEESGNLVLTYLSRAQTAQTKEDLYDVFYKEGGGDVNISGAKETFDGVRSARQAELGSELQKAIERYTQLYPLMTDRLQELKEEIATGIYVPETIAESETLYGEYLARVEACVLPTARENAKAEINRVIQQQESSYDTAEVFAAIDAAQTVAEVETLRDGAISEIEKGLDEARANGVKELETFVDEHLTEYNYGKLWSTLQDAKEKIESAVTGMEIERRTQQAMLDLTYEYVNAEIDRYASTYAEYGISEVIGSAKLKLIGNHTEEEYFGLLADTEEDLCAAAKVKAVADLTAYNDYYRLWDRTPSVNAINAAADIRGVAAAFTQGMTELRQLVSQRDNAITSARDMLTVYAQSLNVENLAEVREAITSINEAQTADDVAQLFDEAKAKIERAADAEQKRVDSVNAGLIACTVIFGLAAVALTVVLILFLRKKTSKKPKKITYRKNPDSSER